MKGALSHIGEAVGNTPIVALGRIFPGLCHRLFAKCEFTNPGGSIKDRIGFFMIDRAERAGLLKPGGTIVAATAGNTGMALAMAAAQKGYRMICVMTSKMSEEKISLMRLFGAKVVLSPYGVPPEHPDSFINRARHIASSIPHAWFVDQFGNPDNFLAHYTITGPEIWDQTEGEIDVLVAGMGTGGTLAGVGTYLKEKKPTAKIVLADTRGSIFRKYWECGEIGKGSCYWVEGIGGDFIPANTRFDIIDDVVTVPDELAFQTTQKLLQKEGIFAGGSSGCILAAALKWGQKHPGPPKNILAILPDGGRSYLSTLFNPQWRREKGFGPT